MASYVTLSRLICKHTLNTHMYFEAVIGWFLFLFSPTWHEDWIFNKCLHLSCVFAAPLFSLLLFSDSSFNHFLSLTLSITISRFCSIFLMHNCCNFNVCKKSYSVLYYFIQFFLWNRYITILTKILFSLLMFTSRLIWHMTIKCNCSIFTELSAEKTTKNYWHRIWPFIFWGISYLQVLTLASASVSVNIILDVIKWLKDSQI